MCHVFHVLTRLGLRYCGWVCGTVDGSIVLTVVNGGLGHVSCVLPSVTLGSAALWLGAAHRGGAGGGLGHERGGHRRHASTL